MCLAIKRCLRNPTRQSVRQAVVVHLEIVLVSILETWASDSTPPVCVNLQWGPQITLNLEVFYCIHLCKDIETELFRFQVRRSV